MKPITGAIAPRVPKAVFRLWKYLESLKQYGGWISVSIRHLMAKYGRKKPTVKAWFGVLFRAGILSSKRRGPHPPVYTVLIPTNDTCSQRHLFTEQEELESTPQVQHHPPAERQQRPDDAALSPEVELKRLAGIPGNRVTAGDRAFLAGLDAPRAVVEVGILLGRARKLAQRATTGRNEPIRSLWYFAGSIAEVRDTVGISQFAVYRRRLEQEIARMTA